MKLLKKYKLTLVTLVVLLVLFFVRREFAVSAIGISLSSVGIMLTILPPILLIVNLLDVLIPREVIIRHMGENARFKGYFWAFALGTFGAGPLYVAFPIAALLAKKGARLAFIVFFLGTWTTTKLPIFLYELNFFGVTFTSIHVFTGFSAFFLISILMEKILLKKDRDLVYAKLSEK